MHIWIDPALQQSLWLTSKRGQGTKEWDMTSRNTAITTTSILLLSVGISSAALAGQATLPTWEPDLVPSGAVAGECYARVEIPAQYAISTENVMVEEAYSRIEVRQPQLAKRQEQVLTKEASVRYEVRQPRYKTVSEQIMVRPAYDKLSVTPPQFRTVTETIQTSAPRLIWKRGNPGRLRAQGYKIHGTADDRRRTGYSSGNYSGANVTSFTSQLPATHCGPTCEIWCLVEEPGESVSFNRKVMTSPGQVRRIPVPAKYTSINKQVVAEPGSVREIPIPAEYKSITVEDVVNPGGEHMVNVPAKYGSVNKRTLVQSERYEWRRVVCRPGTVGVSGVVQRQTGYGSRYSKSGYKTNSAPITYGSSSSTSHNYSTGTAPIIYRTREQSGSGQTTTTQTSRTYYYGTNKPVQ